jgi:RNA polymerase sigma-70 factor (ECF subfamily)
MKYLKDEEKAKDITQQIFEKLLTELPRHEIRNFKSWLHSVAKNTCLMSLRSATEKNISINYSEEFMDFEDNLHQEDKEEKEVELEKLEKAIVSLNKEQRICIELFYLKELTYDEIANETGYSIKMVKSYLQNGKRNLKIRIEKDE